MRSQCRQVPALRELVLHQQASSAYNVNVRAKDLPFLNMPTSHAPQPLHPLCLPGQPLCAG